MWPSVNGNVLTNQIDIRSEKTHEVTRCKQALSHQPSLHTHLFTISSLLVITCLLIPHTCCTSSSPSISAPSQHSLFVRSAVHIPEPSQTPLCLPVCFLTSDGPVSPPLPGFLQEITVSHCKLSHLNLVTLCFTHLSFLLVTPQSLSNKYPCLTTYLCVS